MRLLILYHGGRGGGGGHIFSFLPFLPPAPDSPVRPSAHTLFAYGLFLLLWASSLSAMYRLYILSGNPRYPVSRGHIFFNFILNQYISFRSLVRCSLISSLVMDSNIVASLRRHVTATN